MDDLGKHPYFRKHPYKYIHTEIFSYSVCVLPLTLKKHLPRDRDHPGSVSRRFSEAWGIQLMAEGLNQSQSSEFGRCGSDLSGDFWHKLQGLCIYTYIYIYIQINITYSFMFFHWVDQKGVSCCLISRNRLPMILPFFLLGWGQKEGWIIGSFGAPGKKRTPMDKPDKFSFGGMKLPEFLILIT